MNWISLALRNLLRNTRRSVTTVAAVALGYAAINIFGGFANYMFASIEDGYIFEQLNGHVQIWKKGALNYGGSDPAKYLISAGEFKRIKAFAAKDERIALAAGMLEIKGNVDYEGIPGFFLGQALVPSEKEKIQSRSTALRSVSGKKFDGELITDEMPFSIGITTGMAENMKIGIGSNVILMAPSVNGQMNALDAEVAQILEVASQALNNRYIFLPLELGQNLYDTDGVSCVRFLLKEGYDSKIDSDAIAASLRSEFPEDKWEVIPWHEVSKLYNRTKRMFDIIFGLVFAIITLIVTMSVLNTIGMAVIERTREIGTLRAIGLKRPGVVMLFAIESVCLGFIGATVGLLVTLLFSGVIAMIQPVWEPPVSARIIIWEIRLVPEYLLLTFGLLTVFTMLAAIAPARRAAKQDIVDALGHV